MSRVRIQGAAGSRHVHCTVPMYVLLLSVHVPMYIHMYYCYLHKYLCMQYCHLCMYFVQYLCMCYCCLGMYGIYVRNIDVYSFTAPVYLCMYYCCVHSTCSLQYIHCMYCIPMYEVLLSIHVPLYVVLLSIYYICTVCIIVAYTYTVPMYVQYVLS